MKKAKTVTDKVLSLLKQRRKLSPVDIASLGVTNPFGIIARLRSKGYNIVTYAKAKGNVCLYQLKK